MQLLLSVQQMHCTSFEFRTHTVNLVRFVTHVRAYVAYRSDYCWQQHLPLARASWRHDAVAVDGVLVAWIVAVARTTVDALGLGLVSQVAKKSLSLLLGGFWVNQFRSLVGGCVGVALCPATQAVVPKARSL